MSKKEPIENRSKRQISLILSWYFTYDLVALICSVLLFVCLCIVFFGGGLWFRIALPTLLAVPVAIRTILTIALRKKLYNNHSKTIVLEKPTAKVIRTRQGDVYTLKGLKISGLVNGKKQSYFEYPLKDSSALFFKKEKSINGKATIEINVIDGTHVINNFYEEKQRSKSKVTKKEYLNFTNGKAKKFLFEPIEVKESDLLYFLTWFSSYEELYFVSGNKKYVLVRLSVSGKVENRYITVDKLNIDNPEKTIEWLNLNGFIIDENLKLIGIFDSNDPAGFFLELDSIKEQ